MACELGTVGIVGRSRLVGALDAAMSRFAEGGIVMGAGLCGRGRVESLTVVAGVLFLETELEVALGVSLSGVGDPAEIDLSEPRRVDDDDEAEGVRHDT